MAVVAGLRRFDSCQRLSVTEVEPGTLEETGTGDAHGQSCFEHSEPVLNHGRDAQRE
jgi:hypothetical protein